MRTQAERLDPRRPLRMFSAPSPLIVFCREGTLPFDTLYSIFHFSHDSRDRLDHSPPPARFHHQLFSSRLRQLVELRLAIVLAASPVRPEPASIFQPVQRRI